MNKPFDYSYLGGLTFVKKVFVACEDNDHEHCELCWDKFSEATSDLHEGFCSIGKYQRWVCCDCFKQNQDLYDWILYDKLL